jgi:hypothetical protein
MTTQRELRQDSLTAAAIISGRAAEETVAQTVPRVAVESYVSQAEETTNHGLPGQIAQNKRFGQGQTSGRSALRVFVLIGAISTSTKSYDQQNSKAG